jgi:hypothetical protein
VYWFSLQLLSKTFLILWEIQRDTVINVKTSLRTHSCRIWMKLHFPQQIFEEKTLKHLIYSEFAHWESSCSMRADGRTRRSQYPLSAILRRRLKTVKTPRWSWASMHLPAGARVQNTIKCTYVNAKSCYSLMCYKVVQIWLGQTVTCLHTNSPGHISTTLYNPSWWLWEIGTEGSWYGTRASVGISVSMYSEMRFLT